MPIQIDRFADGTEYVIGAPRIPAPETGLTLYVDGSNGLDTNSGLSVSEALKTYAGAIKTLERYDFINGGSPQVRFLPGTYLHTYNSFVDAEWRYIRLPHINSDRIDFMSHDPTNKAVLDGNGLNVAYVQAKPSFVSLDFINGIASTQYSHVSIVGNCVFNINAAYPGNTAIYSSIHSMLDFASGSSIKINCNKVMYNLFFANALSTFFIFNSIVDVSNTQGTVYGVFQSCFNSYFDVNPNNTFIGNPSGPKFIVNTSATIYTQGSGLTFLPGMQSGIIDTSTNGVYI